MEKLIGIKIIYSHPASPLEGIFLNKIYTISIDGKELYIDDGNYKKNIKFELLKQLFSPLDGCSWDELLKEEIKPEINVNVFNFKEKE